MDAPRFVPTSPVVGAGVGGAFAIVLVYVLGLFKVEMPMEVASAISVLVAWGGSYATKLVGKSG